MPRTPPAPSEPFLRSPIPFQSVEDESSIPSTRSAANSTNVNGGRVKARRWPSVSKLRPTRDKKGGEINVLILPIREANKLFAPRLLDRRRLLSWVRWQRF